MLPGKDKRGIHRHAICCQKKSTWGWYPPWPVAIQYWMMILDVLKPVWNSGGSTKIKRWNFWQTHRHLDYYSWALQVCQGPVECRRWDNEGRAWSHSSESAASKHTHRLGPRGIFRSRWNWISRSIIREAAVKRELIDLHVKMCKFSHYTRLFRGGNVSVTDYFSSSGGRKLKRSTHCLKATRTKWFCFLEKDEDWYSSHWFSM